MRKEECAELLCRMCERPMPTKTYIAMQDINSEYRRLLLGETVASQVEEIIMNKGGVSVGLEFSEFKANIKINCFYSHPKSDPIQCCVLLEQFKNLLAQYDSERCKALNDLMTSEGTEESEADLSTTSYRHGM